MLLLKKENVYRSKKVKSMIIIDILSGTPPWVWLVFGYLIIIGIRALRPATVSFYQIIIPVAIFSPWSFHAVISLFSSSLMSIVTWIGGLLLGIHLGISLFSRGITVDRTKMVAHLPGSPRTLILYLIFFCMKYAMRASLAINPELAQSFAFMLIDVGTSATISGIFLGRLFFVMRKR